MTENDLSIEDLPMTFQVKYLGSRQTSGLWGVKHTRKPLDYLVECSIPRRDTLPFVDITICTQGLNVQNINEKAPTKTGNPNVTYAIDTISYGVQDLKYTRVFCMIVCNSQALEATYNKLKDDENLSKNKDKQKGDSEGGKTGLRDNLFTCHAFLCASKYHARKLTFALATAFKHFADVMKGNQEKREKLVRTIDLRTPEQIAETEGSETEA